MCQRFINFELSKSFLRDGLGAVEDYLNYLTRESEGSILYHKLNRVGSTQGELNEETDENDIAYTVCIIYDPKRSSKLNQHVKLSSGSYSSNSLGV